MLRGPLSRIPTLEALRLASVIRTFSLTSRMDLYSGHVMFVCVEETRRMWAGVWLVCDTNTFTKFPIQYARFYHRS
jgi:hypothetical protein